MLLHTNAVLVITALRPIPITEVIQSAPSCQLSILDSGSYHVLKQF